VVANEELEAERHALADALADISHQLRTPLTSLGIELELVRKAAATPEDAQRVRDCGRMLEQAAVARLVAAQARAPGRRRGAS
jgi:signal transduction histidine kinase